MDSSIPSEVNELFKYFSSIPLSELGPILDSHHGQALISLLLSTLQSLASSSISQASPLLNPAQKHATKSSLGLISHLLDLKEQVAAGGKRGGGVVSQLEEELSCLDLCLAGDAVYPKSVRRAISRLMNSDKASNILVSVGASLRNAINQLQASPSIELLQTVLRATRVTSRLGAIFQMVEIDGEEIISMVATLKEVYDSVLPTIAAERGWQSFSQQSLQASSPWVTSWLNIKFEILQVFKPLLQLFKTKASPASFSKLLKLLSSSSTTSSPPPQLRSPLISLSLLSDLQVSSPASLVHPFSDSSSLQIISKVKEEAHAALVAVGSPPTSTSSLPTPRFSGPAWDALKSEAQTTLALRGPGNGSSAKKKGKGKARATESNQDFNVDPELLDLVSAILPHLSEGTEGELGLRKRLVAGRYQGKSGEEVVQMLLDEEENESGLPVEETLEVVQEMRSPTPPPFNTSTPRNPIPSRANVFDEQPLDMSRLRWGGSAQPTAEETAMSNDLKAQILARVEAQEREQLEEEWDLEEGNGAGRGYQIGQEVGFEEELEEEEDFEPKGIHRRQGISTLGGPNGQARDWTRRLEDLSDEEDSEQDDLTAMEGKGVPASAPSSSLPPANSASNVERERSDERILVKAWSTLGEGLFSKDARKSKDRKNLLLELGGGWDDHRVESWATMFNRNVIICAFRDET